MEYFMVRGAVPFPNLIPRSDFASKFLEVLQGRHFLYYMCFADNLLLLPKIG